MVKFKLSIVQKIAFAGILTVLTMVCQKVFAINYISAIPFVRVSFCGPALIIFSSILLGPWFGLLVGAASDLLGFLIFDPKLFGSLPFFQITFIYALLGFVSYFVFQLVFKIKSKKIMMLIEGIAFLALVVGIALFVGLNDGIYLYSTTYTFGMYEKILIPLFVFILLGLTFIISSVLDKKLSNRNKDISIFHISFASFIVEMAVMLIFGTAMKTWAFGPQSFIGILFSQILVSFFNISLNTFFLFYILDISKKLIRSKE